MRVGFDLAGELRDDLDTRGGQGAGLARVVREQSDPADEELAEDRRGQREVPAVRGEAQGVVGLDRVEAALAELRAGRMVVVVDDEGRENEGDLTMAAEMVTPEAINFMATHGKGLVCLALTGERLHELDLPAMVSDNTALGGTAFTVSIDAKGHGVTTGISAHDRAHTIRTAIDPRCRPQDLARPGHVFPVRARAGGVLERRGHTEAAVDLARLAGFSPAGVICEIVNDDGTMARVPDLARFCKQHGLVMITVAELARHRAELDTGGFLAAMDGVFADCLRDPQQLQN